MRNFLLIVAHLSAIAAAWNSEAHKIVSRIAAKLIEKKTSRFIKEHLPKRPGTTVPHAESALVFHASWADQVSSTAEYESTAALHFVDTPFRACAPFNSTRDCGRGTGRCLVSGIAEYLSRAANFSVTQGERAEALKFVIHLVADAHSGMHVGFEQDAGGNLIYLTEPALSLHEIWDSELLKAFKASSGDSNIQSWPRLSTALIQQLKDAPETMAEYQVELRDASIEEATAFASAIVSETAMAVTCQLGYKDNGEWIPDRNHSLSGDYLVSRGMAVTEQLIRAGVRLAQALDTIATAFFWSENQAIAPAVSPVQRNRFADLDFHADNFVFDPQASSETGGDTELEIDDEDVVRFTVPTSAAATAGSKSTKRRKRATGAKRKTDLNSLVLVKENGRFCITSEARANVKTDLCGFGASVVGIRFGAAEHETFFWLDPLIFGTERVPQLARLEAIFKHLKGVSGSDLVVPEIALDFSAGAAVSFQSLTDSLTMPAFRELTGSETAKLPVATFETISDFVRPVESETVLRKRFGGKFPSAETRIRDVLRREPGLMVILHGKALLVSSLSGLQGEKGNRFVLNAIRVGGHHALVDSRIIDEVIPPSVFAELLKLLLRPEIRAAKKALVEANYPIIRVLPNLADLMTSGESTVTLVGLNAKCTQLTAIDREAGYRSLDFTLTSVAESRRRIANAAKGMIGSFADGNPVYDVLKRLIPHVIDDFRAEADDDGETVLLPVHHIEGQTILAALSSIQASGAEFSPASLARERRRFEGSFV